MYKKIKINQYMSVETTLNKLRALDLSKYPYFEAKELFRDLGQVGFVINTLHAMKVITRARSGNGYISKSGAAGGITMAGSKYS